MATKKTVKAPCKKMACQTTKPAAKSTKAKPAAKSTKAKPAAKPVKKATKK
ncbi:MAG: hypothetical protein NTY19_15045 [Planctomycetota bacterium]|nr:hypothetical protein [Planctomycetota bacterium]